MTELKDIQAIERLYTKYVRHGRDQAVAKDLIELIPYLCQKAKVLVWIENAIEVCNEENIVPKDLAELLKEKKKRGY